MSEYRPILERVGANFSAPDLTMDRVVRRGERLRRNRRVAAGIVGAAVAIAVAVGGATLLRSAPTPAVDEPTPPPQILHPGETLDQRGGRIVAVDPLTGERRMLATVDCRDSDDRCDLLLQRYELSADGGWLLYDAWTCVITGPCDPDAGIWIVDAGGELQHLTDVCDPPGSCIEERWAWSPTGHTLAVFGDVDDAAFSLFDPATGERTPLEPRGEAVDALAWQPDGSSLAYATSSDLTVTDPETDQTTRIPLPPVTVHAVRWSPDETRILLDTVDDVGVPRVSVADLEAGTMRVVAEDASNPDEASAWSPDGTRIAYVLRPPLPGRGYGYEVWVIGADGSNPLKLFDGAGDGPPVWSPDGTGVAVNVVLDGERLEWAVFATGAAGDPTAIDPRVVNRWSQAPGLQHADP